MIPMNPVTTREFLCTFRSPKALVLLLFPAVLCSGLVLLRWPTEGIVSQAGTRSLEIFSLFGCGLGTVVLLLTPAPAAVSFVKERLQGTLVLLLHAPLSPARIYSGKLLGVTSLVLMALAMSLPAAAACYALGGVTFLDHLIPLYTVLLFSTLEFAALCLLISSYSRSIDAAVRSSYAWTLVVAIGLLGPYQVLQGGSIEVLVRIALWIRNLSPLPALLEVLGRDDIAGQGLVTSSNLLAYFIASGILIAILATLTIRRLNSRIFDEARDSGVMTEDRVLSERVMRRFVYLVDPQRRSSNIGSWTNPVLVKEFRSRRFGRATWILRLIGLCAMGSIGLTYFAATGVKDWSVELISAMLIVLQMALIVLLAPGLSAGLLANEHDSGSWSLLRMTPLSPHSIAIGKLLSVVWTMLLVLLATLPGYLVMIYLKPIVRQQVLLVVGSLLLASAFTIVVSAAIGAFFRKSTPATVTSYAALTSLTAIPMLIWLGRDAPFGFQVVETALVLNPMSSALAVMETPGFEHYRLIPGNWIFMASGCLVGLIVFWWRTWRQTCPD